MKSGFVSKELQGIRPKRVYTEKEVRRAFCNSTNNLDEDAFQSYLLRNSHHILIVQTAFDKSITFNGTFVDAKGIEGANAARSVRSTETPQSPVAEGDLPQETKITLSKYKNLSAWMKEKY